MTEKRFEVTNISENGNTGLFWLGKDNLSVYDVVRLLNEFEEENEELKKQLQCSREEADDYCEELMGKDEFVRLYKRQRDDALKENEQLKKENYELHKRLGDFELFERYMKERTSKTSLEDIIGIVKTDEPTNSVELKKELYK